VASQADALPAMAKVSHVFQIVDKPGQHTWGGAERHLRLLLPALAQAGHDVEAIVMTTNAAERIAEGLEEMRRGGVRVTQIDRRSHGGLVRKLPGLAWWCMRLAKALRARRHRIVHVHLDVTVAPVVAVLAGCRTLCLTIHVDDPRWLGPAWRCWLAAIDRFVLRYVAISRRVQEHWSAVSGAALEKIDVVEYGVPAPDEAAPSRADHGLPAGAFVVGFVGRLVAQKDVATLLRALAEVPAAHGCIVGNGPLRAGLQAMADGLGLGRVRFLGAVENAARLMPLFDVFCLPSRFEGLGLVLVEAMLRRVPCIGSRAGAIPDVLEHGRSGMLFTPGDAHQLAGLIRAARDDREHLRALGAAASERARERFSIERMVAQTAAFYRKLAGGVAAGA